ncbi:hypothetical protein [Streptomyces gilvosporeus]|uniref:hypothetical protein n=1 Tax=Streptomyces gilvosporeus TaxID=553510 RepID=UPI0019395E80|nr:hypothetical protein [Streptomyces gilvosporeus]
MARYGPCIQAGDIGTSAGVALTLLISIGAWTDAQRQARIGREANEISHRQAEAAERRAWAVEEALASALRLLGERAPSLELPEMVEMPEVGGGGPGEVRWEVGRLGRYGFELRNVGSATAFGVRVDPDGLGGVARNLPEDATVRPGEGVRFVMAATFGRRVPGEVRVRWGGYGRAEAQVVAVPAG